MQAIILAAGMGKRLGDLTKDNTKCMVKVNGVCLIDRLLGQLAELGLSRVVMVIGYQGAKLREHVGDHYGATPVEYIENPIYDRTNNIYSLYLAKDKLQEEDTLLIESDLIFEGSLFRKIVDNPYPNLALVAKYEPWMDGTMVCLDEERQIVDFISKKAFNYADIARYYKTVNIYKFGRDFLRTHYVPFLEAYSKALGYNEYYEQVLRVITLLDKCELKGLPLDGERWYEIDDVQDLDIAEAIFAAGKRKDELYHRRYGGYWRFPALKDFCYLVNPYFPPQRMRDELRSSFDTLLTEYPSGMRVNSLIMAKNFGLRQDYVVVGNGAAELIKALMEDVEGRTGICYPTFEEYPNRCRHTIVPFVPANRDFTYTARDLMDFYGENPVDTLLLVNPDNPSGNFIPLDGLLRLLEWTAQRHTRMVVDESFVDFSDGGDTNSLLTNSLLERYPHLTVVKSISKSYGVPGLRLGLAASANRGVVKGLRQSVSIWNVNSFAEFYLQIYSKYDSLYKQACKRFREERELFLKELQEVGFLRVIPSQANYFLCEVTSRFTSQELSAVLLERHNLLIKDCGTKSAFQGRDYIRLAVRDRQDNHRLVNILKAIGSGDN